MNDSFTLMIKFDDLFHPRLVRDETPYSLFCAGYHLCEKEKNTEITRLEEQIEELKKNSI